MGLPLKLPWELAQTRWANDINPILANPFNQIAILNVKLVTGVNVINHLMAQKMQGWIVTDIDQPITLYRSQPFNDKTLTLTASGNANAMIGVF